MGATRSTETLVPIRNTRRYVPEDGNFQKNASRGSPSLQQKLVPEAEKQCFWRVEHGRCVGLTALRLSVTRLSTQCGILNIPQARSPPWSVTGIALLFYLFSGSRNSGLPARVFLVQHKMWLFNICRLQHDVLNVFLFQSLTTWKVQ
jgi:hypothetical protein